MNAFELASPVATTPIDYDDWWAQWQPLPNRLREDAPFDGAMFETFGEELAHVLAAPEQTIWTLIEEGDVTVIVNGLRFVNRLGYFVTELPWPDGAQFEVGLD